MQREQRRPEKLGQAAAREKNVKAKGMLALYRPAADPWSRSERPGWARSHLPMITVQQDCELLLHQLNLQTHQTIPSAPQYGGKLQ